MTQNTRRYYLTPDEEEPHRTKKSKCYSTIVMFLAAVARLRWDTRRNQHFDGKLKICPFITIKEARRNSWNTSAGTPVTKAMTSITNMEYCQFIIEKLLPAIKEKWPSNASDCTIKIQQDNAQSHISPMDVEFCNDLGYFNAIQSLQHKAAPQNIDELILAVY